MKEFLAEVLDIFDDETICKNEFYIEDIEYQGCDGDCVDCDIVPICQNSD